MTLKRHKQINIWMQDHEEIMRRVAELNSQLPEGEKKWSGASYINQLIKRSKVKVGK